MSNQLQTSEIESITRMVMQALEKREDSSSGFLVPIGVSARHIHLTQADVS